MSMTASPSLKRERPLLWLLAAVQLSHLMDFMIVMPLGPELMRTFSISAASFGAMVSAYTLASAAMGLLGVLWLDRFDRKRTLLGLFAVFIVATLACGFAPGHGWLVAARTLAGAAAGLMSAGIMAIVGDLIPPERRGRAIGTVMSALGISAVAGVPLGLGIANLWGWRAPFWVIGAFASAVWLCLLWVLPPVTSHLASARDVGPGAAPRPAWTLNLALGWVLTFSVVFSSFLLIPYLGTFMVGNLGLRLADLSWIYLCGGAATLVAAKSLGHLVDRLGPARVLALLLVGTMVPHLGFTHLPPVAAPVVAGVFMVFMALTSTRVIPTIALIASRVPPALRGRYLAVNMAAGDGASGIAAWVSGLMLAGTAEGALQGFGHVGWLAVGVSALSLALLWTFVRRSQAPQRTSHGHPHQEAPVAAAAHPG